MSDVGLSACEQMRVSQAQPQRPPPPPQPQPQPQLGGSNSLGALDTGALARLLAANQALVQQQAGTLHALHLSLPLPDHSFMLHALRPGHFFSMPDQCQSMCHQTRLKKGEWRQNVCCMLTCLLPDV